MQQNIHFFFYLFSFFHVLSLNILIVGAGVLMAKFYPNIGSIIRYVLTIFPKGTKYELDRICPKFLCASISWGLTVVIATDGNIASDSLFCKVALVLKNSTDNIRWWLIKVCTAGPALTALSAAREKEIVGLPGDLKTLKFKEFFQVWKSVFTSQTGFSIANDSRKS